MRNKIICFSLLFVISFVYISYTVTTEETISRYGSSGQEVKNIQTRLKQWGYYNGAVDGVYGSKTVTAVKYFQRKNGITVDGIAGSATLAALGLPAGTTSTSNNSNVYLLARLINGEARGESYTGQVAVGAVILNRVEHPSFPKTIAGVVYQPGAFTAVWDGQVHAQMTATAISAAKDALNGWDPTYGAIYYFNPNTATNKWIWSRPVIIRIGKHVFCR